MIIVSRFPNNQRLAELVAIMNKNCNYKKGHYDNISFKRPIEDRGYFALLKAAVQLGQFTWQQVLLNCSMTVTIIDDYVSRITYLRQACKHANPCMLKHYESNLARVNTFTKFAHTHLGFYRSFFKRHGIFEKVTGTGRHCAYRVTPLGIELFKALNTQMLINQKVIK